MVEQALNPRTRLLKSNAIASVIDCFELPEQLELRYVNKRLGEIVPKCIKHLKYNMTNNEKDDKQLFYKNLKSAKKVEITNINGGAYHLTKLKEIADQVGNKCEYLFLNFDGATVIDEDSKILAKQYAEELKKFSYIKTLKFEILDDGNITQILQNMIEDSHFPWFHSVRTLKCYLVRNLLDKDPALYQNQLNTQNVSSFNLKYFFTKFENLETLKGITEDEFDPLELFLKNDKKVPNISWTIPSNTIDSSFENEFYQFLDRNQTKQLTLYGGLSYSMQQPKFDTQYLSYLHLVNMPGNVKLSNIFTNLPQLKVLRLENLANCNKYNFMQICNSLMTYKGLERLDLEFVAFELEDVKQELLNVFLNHSQSLKHLSFSRNKVSTQLISYFAEKLKNNNVLEFIDLKHLKVLGTENKIDWVDLIKIIAELSHDKKRCLQIGLSGYQVYLKKEEMQNYLEKEQPNIQIELL